MPDLFSLRPDCVHLLTISSPNSCLKPGGWVEFQDWNIDVYSTDGTLKPDHGLAQLSRESIKRRDAAGFVTSPGPRLLEWVKDAGFVNIQVLRFPVPIGTWPKDAKYVSTILLSNCFFDVASLN